MIHPSYILNPGDMFSVTPKWVMQAAGAHKFYLGSQEKLEELSSKAQELLENIKGRSTATPAKDEEEVEDIDETQEEDPEAENLMSPEQRANKKALRELRKETLTWLETKKDTLSAKQKQNLRALRNDIRTMFSKKQFEDSHIAEAKQRFSQIIATTATDEPTSNEATIVSQSPNAATRDQPSARKAFVDSQRASEKVSTIRLATQYILEQSRRYEVSESEQDELRILYTLATQLPSSEENMTPEITQGLSKHMSSVVKKIGLDMSTVQTRMEAEFRPEQWAAMNPYEVETEEKAAGASQTEEGNDNAETKGSASLIPSSPRGPWRPRPYMSAFAFIPRYLEVNQNVCSAVYLRHPVARPGLAEVPTPFSEGVNQLAFNWYLRRR